MYSTEATTLTPTLPRAAGEGEKGGEGKRRGGGSAAAPAGHLNRRTGNRAVGAEHAAVAGLRLEHRCAPLALIEKLARVRRHRFQLGVTALRARQQRLQNRTIQLSYPTQALTFCPELQGALAEWVL